jgi:prepilin-type processing-associated H-X9-DG protein
MSDIREGHEKLKGKVLTITRIIIPILIVMFCIGIIILTLKETAARKTCGTNLPNLSKAMLIYTNHHDQLLTPKKWCDLLIEHNGIVPKHFRCKSADGGPCNYALNENIAELGTSAQPDIVVLFETRPGWNQVGGPEILTTENHKGKGCYVAFLDSHVEFIKAEDINQLKWKPDG